MSPRPAPVMRLSGALAALLFAGSAAALTLYPDYAGLLIPPNIAPLNFDVEDAPADVQVTLAGGPCKRTFGREVRIPEDFWRELLAQGAYTITIEAGGQKLFSATNTVAHEPIDPVLAYRLIPPSYENYRRIGLYWRDLTTFAEHPLYTNLQSSTKQCVNCHAFCQGDPDTLLFHLRAENPGTLIYRGKDDLGIKRDFKGGPFFSSGVYPAWHPTGRFIAFSINDTMQCFYYANTDKIEVMDTRSDLMLYDVEKDEALPIELTPELFDCFPAWAPDGQTLYSVAATPGFDAIPDDKEERSRQAILGYTNLRYNLIARTFDPQTRTFSAPYTLIDAAKEQRSATLPRISPNGRWLVFTLGPQGVFHIWHKEADLWLIDLDKKSARPLAEVNSPDVESYHAFSSNGAWMVFSTRRNDGTYTRPYFTHFDPETGRCSKPFIIPQEEPAHHDRRMLSYNVPEFAKAPPSRSPRTIRKLAEQPAQKPTFPKK